PARRAARALPGGRRGAGGDAGHRGRRGGGRGARREGERRAERRGDRARARAERGEHRGRRPTPRGKPPADVPMARGAGREPRPLPRAAPPVSERQLSQEPRLRVFTEQTLRVCAPLAELAVGNPCSPSRNEDVARALGAEYVEPSATVAPGLDPRVKGGNIAAMKRLVRKLLPVLQERYKAGGEVSDVERRIYIRVV